MNIDHTPIDVPRVDAPPEFSGNEWPCLEFVYFVLTRGIARAPCIITADTRVASTGDATWVLRSASGYDEAHDLGTMSRGAFRSCLARLCVQFIAGNAYGDCGYRPLRQGDRSAYTAFFVDNGTGLSKWVRIDVSTRPFVESV